MDKDPLLRCCMITLNNWTPEEFKEICAFSCQYIIIGKEIGEEGTPHLQIYVELNKQTRFSVLKKSFPRAHIQARTSTQAACIKYCKKEGDYVEIGLRRQQGRRNDIDTALAMLTERVTIRDAIDNGNLITLGTIKAYEVLQKYVPMHRNCDQLRVIWIYGPGGAGKTRRAYSMAGTDVVRLDLFTKGWFDGYDHHRSVIIDDFNPSPEDNEAFDSLLAIMDRYPLRCNVKNSTVRFMAEIIIITSQLPPWMIWSPQIPGTPRMEPGPAMYEKDVRLRQIMRRITELYHLTGNEVENKYPTITVV